jgi:hypothetical protein
MESVLIAVGPRQTAQDLAIPFQEWRHHAFQRFSGHKQLYSTSGSPWLRTRLLHRATLTRKLNVPN